LAEFDVCPLDELPPGEVKIILADLIAIGVYNANAELYAIEDRCTHDDGPLAEGDWDPDSCVAICPRHGANFDIRTGAALTLPATQPVETYAVRVDENGMIKVKVV
jgi:3-phenylpropionate/trans-cinnamate dioxygenase ferredoxin subunit